MNLNELKRLSAKDILKAEIVTVPGAQYSSKTNAVIRLRAVRKRGQGLSGSLYSEYMQGRYSPHGYEDVQLNYRTGGLDIFGEVGAGLDRSHTTAHSEPSSIPPATGNSTAVEPRKPLVERFL